MYQRRIDSQAGGPRVEPKRKPGRPRVPRNLGRPCLYERPEVAAALQRILDDLEISDVNADVRLVLQRILWRRDYFHGDGPGHVTLLLRTILESEGNGVAALIEPVVSAVCDSMRPQWIGKGLRWIEVFDDIPLTGLLETMKSLQIFKPESLGTYLGHAVRNRLWAIFGPDPIIERAPNAKKAKVRARGALPTGRPKRQAEQPERMAA
jgi:hypothetical protein